MSPFARGMLKHLFTRIYFGEEDSNKDDPVLSQVSADRRETLIAKPQGSGEKVYRFDIRIQEGTEGPPGDAVLRGLTRTPHEAARLETSKSVTKAAPWRAARRLVKDKETKHGPDPRRQYPDILECPSIFKFPVGRFRFVFCHRRDGWF